MSDLRITEVEKTFTDGLWRANFVRRDNGQKYLDLEYGSVGSDLGSLSDGEVDGLFRIVENMAQYARTPWSQVVEEAKGKQQQQEKKSEGSAKLPRGRGKGGKARTR